VVSPPPVLLISEFVGRVRVLICGLCRTFHGPFSTPPLLWLGSFLSVSAHGRFILGLLLSFDAWTTAVSHFICFVCPHGQLALESVFPFHTPFPFVPGLTTEYSYEWCDPHLLSSSFPLFTWTPSLSCGLVPLTFDSSVCVRLFPLWKATFLYVVVPPY